MDKLVICNNNTKKYILNYLNDKELININFMSMKEFIDNYYFKYNEKAILYLMNKYNYKYDVCCEYLKNLYYIEDKNYPSNKLNKLVDIKRELDEQELLIYNPLFIDYLKTKEIIFLGRLNKFQLKMIEELKTNYSVEIKEREFKNYSPKIYEFFNIDEEVEFVAYRICELIDKGIDINKIKICNINNDYDNSISRIFKMYNLNIKEKVSLFGMNITKDFINNFDSDINKTIMFLKGKYDNDLVNKLINIINKYSFINDYNKVKELIIEDIKNVYIETNYANQIEVVDYDDYIDDEYVFMLNFNEESVPKKYQDIDYITDSIKPEYLENTVLKNKQEKEYFTKCIKNIKNLVITYKLQSSTSSYYPSSLIKELDLIVEKGCINKNINYSKLNNRLRTCSLIDDYRKYGVYNNDLELYTSNYQIPYQTYSNKYTKVNLNKDKLLLSYTSMNNYYKCSFRYYLQSILKLDKESDKFSQYLGSIFHYVLEKNLKEGNDIEELINGYIKDNNIEFSVKDKYFLDKLKKELPKIIAVIKKQDNFIKLDKRKYEESVLVEFGDASFMGVIDKVMYDDDIYAIVDYKTGKTDINLKMMKYGIGMQLAVYLYLAHKKFGGHIAGFYLNKILTDNMKDNPKKTYEEQYESNLKLVGYSNSDYIDKFDKTYKDSSLIQSLRVKKDGDFYHYSKVLNNDKINDLIELVEDKILECIDNINKANFSINPKNIDGKDVGCEYCPFSDICFKNNEDIVYLGGEENA